MMLRYAQIRVEDSRSTVYAYCLVEVELRLLVLLLLLEDVAKAPPGVVVALISLECLLVALLGLFKVFIVDIFVSAKGMCIAEIDI